MLKAASKVPDPLTGCVVPNRLRSVPSASAMCRSVPWCCVGPAVMLPAPVLSHAAEDPF